MSVWAGGQCELLYATCAGTGGYRRPRTRPTARRRSAARPCGTKAGLTAERGKRGSRQGAAARPRQSGTDNDYRCMEGGIPKCTSTIDCTLPSSNDPNQFSLADQKFHVLVRTHDPQHDAHRNRESPPRRITHYAWREKLIFLPASL